MTPSRRRLRSYATRAITLLVTFASGAWAVFIWTADMIGRLAVGDSWGSVAKKMPEWVHLMATTSPWLPGVTCVGLGLVLAYTNWPHDDARDDEAQPASPATVHASAPTARSATMSDMIVVDGAHGRPPSFRRRFADNGSDAVFYLEHSTFHPSVGSGSGWTRPRKYEVFRQARYGRGPLTISFPIASHRPNREGGS